MNVTRAVAVQQTVDVLPTPQSPREDPIVAHMVRSRSPRPRAPERDSEVMRLVREAVAQSLKADADARPATPSSTESRPRWLRKVRAWLEGRWGLGHKRKVS